ncbi:MAG: cytochrome P450 [Pseudomonadota bacterium]
MSQAMPRGTDSAFFVDPHTLMEDPHASFASLRTTHAVIQLGDGHYMALRAEHVFALMTDPRTQQIEGPDYVRLNGIPDGVTARFIADFFLFGDGKTHLEKRGLFARTFAHRAMHAARPQVRAVADRIVAEAPKDEPFDFVEHVAARVPAEMIAAILGLPRSEAGYFAGCVHRLAPAVSPIYPHADHEKIEAAATALFEYVDAHLQARLSAPREDLLSKLVADWRVSQAIPFDSLVHQVLGVIVGGSDTTRAAFAMLVALLLEHPDAWATVKADPSVIPAAVSEAMRYEPSVGSIARFTTAEIDIDGVTVPPGAMLRLNTMSAMRDSAVFAEPDTFNIHRTDHPRLHPVFGNGPHRCLGEVLARVEMEECLAALLSVAPNVEMNMSPKIIGFGGIRQITPMVVRLRAG